MHHLLTILIATCVPVVSTPAEPPSFAQVGPDLPPPRIPFRSFGALQGLTNVTVMSLTQDPEGFLWAGTQNGLFRFDGNRFHQFSRSDGLPGLFVQAMACGPDGTLWIGTDQGLACRARGRIQSITTGAIGRAPVNAIAVTPSDVWIGTSHGLMVGTRESGFRAIPGWSFGSVHALLADQDILWVGTEQGLVECSPRGSCKRWGRKQGLHEECIYALAKDPKGRLWARAASRMWMKRNGSPTFEDMSRYIDPSIAGKTTSLFVDRRGRLWVPSKDRLAILDGDNWSVFRPSQGLPSPWINQVFEDAEGSMWITGVALHQILGQESWTYFNTQSGLPSDTVWGIHRDRQGTLWVGTNRGAARATPSGWSVLRGTEKTQISCLLELPDGRMVASGAPPVLFEWDPRTLRVQKHALPLNPGDKCQGLALDIRGRLWFGSHLSAPLVGERQGSGWKFIPVTLPPGSPREGFTDLQSDTRGGIWLVAQSALYHFGIVGSRRYTVHDGLPPSPTILSRLADGAMFLSCRSTLGWIRFRQGQHGLEVLDRCEGGGRRFPDQVYAAGLDAKGRLWLGGGQGVQVIDQNGTRHFDSGDGLIWCDINAKGFLAEPNGDIWLGTTSGLAHFRAGAQPPLPPPPTRIWEARLGDRALDLFAPGEASASSREQVFHVRFAGLSLQNPLRQETQTRLLGLDPTWRTSDVRALTFPGLRPGQYRFEARSRYGDGPWGPIATLAFRVRPPWWSTWPFLALDALLAGLGIWGLVRYRTYRLAVRNQLLREQVEDATQEILQHRQELEFQARELVQVNSALRERNDQQKHFLGIVAHDLRNPLTTIAMAAEVLQDEKDPAEVNRKALMIRDESLGMSSLVRRFLDIATLDAGKIQAELDLVSLSDAVDRTIQSQSACAVTKGISLLKRSSPGEEVVQADPRFVQEILDNLLSNAIKFSPPGSAVTLRIEPRGPVCVLSVEDQGPGLQPEDHARLFQRYAILSAKPTGGEKSTGLGLSIVKHLVELQGGRIWAKSEPGRGAAFCVEFPAAAAGENDEP